MNSVNSNFPLNRGFISLCSISVFLMVAYCTLLWPPTDTDDAHRVHYSEITDEYPTHEFWDDPDFGGSGCTYQFAWFHFNPWPDHLNDSETWISFDGHTYMYCDRSDWSSEPTECPTPCLPPLQGPPPPSQKWWSYLGYDTYSDFT